MSDYMIVLGWGAAFIVAGLVAMCRRGDNATDQDVRFGGCVEVRR